MASLAIDLRLEDRFDVIIIILVRASHTGMVPVGYILFDLFTSGPVWVTFHTSMIFSLRLFLTGPVQYLSYQSNH